MRRNAMLAMISSFVLSVMTAAWNLRWWQAAAIYVFGLIVMAILLNSQSRRSAQPKSQVELLENLHQEIHDAACTGPISANEIMDYIQNCINHLKRNEA